MVNKQQILIFFLACWTREKEGMEEGGGGGGGGVGVGGLVRFESKTYPILSPLKLKPSSWSV